MTALKPTKGSLLLAEPFMMDPNFKRTVIFITEHNEDGTVGFVLNRESPLLLSDAVEGFEGFDVPLYLGGPVQTDTLHYLHTYGDKLEGSIEIADGVYWSGNFEGLKAMVQQGEIDPKEIRFFLGYSGWSPGQLDDEMKESSWITHEGKGLHVFNTDPEELWKQVLEEKGGDFAMMVNFPENPILN